MAVFFAQIIGSYRAKEAIFIHVTVYQELISGIFIYMNGIFLLTIGIFILFYSYRKQSYEKYQLLNVIFGEYTGVEPHYKNRK